MDVGLYVSADTSSQFHVPHGRFPIRRARSAVPILVGGLVLVLGIVNRTRVSSVAQSIGAMRLGALAVLSGLIAVHRSVNALMHRASVDGVSFPQMIVATEAHVGACHTIIGGAGIGTGLRIAMLRSWGVDPIGVSVAVILTSIVPSFAMWVIAGAQTIPLMVVGEAGLIERSVAIASVAAVGASLSVVAWVLISDRAPLAGHRVYVRIFEVLHRSTPRLGRAIQGRLPGNPLLAAQAIQGRSRSVLRRNGVFLVISAIAAQLLLALTLVVCASAVAPHAALPIVSLLRTFALLRVLSAFVPIPGGLGIVDVGLVGSLQTAGLDSTHAIAAVALYRSVTFVLPIVTGPICTAIWWVRTGRH